MIILVKQAFVRIARNGVVAGNGFLGPGGLVVTCAHVVAAAFGKRPEHTRPELTPGLEVCFSWVDGKPTISATLAEGGWRYLQGEIDIAVLRLEDAAPSTVRPLSIANTPKEQFLAEMEPYIPSLQVSRRIEAKIEGYDENGRLIVVPVDNSKQWIEPGVSGAPIFVHGGELVEGIVMQEDTAVKQAFLLPASAILKCIKDVEIQLAPEPLIGGSTVDGLSSDLDGIDFEAFLGTDPVAGEDAIDKLVAAGSAILPSLLERSSGTLQNVVRLKELCTRLGADTLAPLAEAIGHGSWGVKLRAAPCFESLDSNTETNNAVYDLLGRYDFDVLRHAISAAGHLGFSSDIRWELARLAEHGDMHSKGTLLNGYSFEKLSDCVVEALGRGFARTGERSELEHIREFVELCDSNGRGSQAEASLDKGLRDLRPIAADRLVENWLHTNDGPWAKLALDALASVRLNRAIEPVAACLKDGRPSVRVAAGICLGSTCSELAAQHVSSALSAGTPIDGVLWAASTLCWRNVEWPELEKLVEAADCLTFPSAKSEVAAQMVVSLGIRKHPAAIDLAQRGLTHSD